MPRRAFVDALKGMKKTRRACRTRTGILQGALPGRKHSQRGDLPEGETARRLHLLAASANTACHCWSPSGKWLDELAPQILPESLLGKAISYTRNQWTFLSRYVNDGRAPIDNNVIERLWISNS